MTVLVTARLLISGRVQGVCFRHYTRETAVAKRVSGWVRNRIDGSVEALLQGEKPAVEAVIDWCRQGPPAAEVTSVHTEWLEGEVPMTGFEIRY